MRYIGLADQEIENIIKESGIIEDQKIVDAFGYAEQEGKSLLEVLIGHGMLPADDFVKILADTLNIRYVSLSGNIPPKEILTIVPEVYAKKKRIVPFKSDQEGLHLAMADPTDIETIDFMKRKGGLPIIVYASSEQDIDLVLEAYGSGLAEVLAGIFEEKNAKNYVQNSNDDANDTSIVRAVEKIVAQAYRNRASDIHFEPREEKKAVVRFRIDGVLHDVAEIPEELHPRVIARIKVMAKLRSDEHQIPQDGKISFELEEESTKVDIRVSIVPITEGEKAVLRLLAERSRQFSLSNLGLNEHDLKKVRDSYKKPYGMILVTGPTGSGKTTTLYAILKLLNKRQVNIMTIEDPVEYDMEGVSQMQVNPKANLTFATGLRSILRQDPNVILVGEIRDRETAEIAVNLALTGHLVISSLHTNDAATAIPRLIDLGIEPFLISSTVSVIIAQRLVRKIHDNCRASREIPAGEIAAKVGWEQVQKIFGVSESNPEEKIRLYAGKGCQGCQNTGFQGRIGIFEVMIADENLKQAISKEENSDFIRAISCKSGMTTLLEDGLGKVKLGMTTVDEVLGATKL